MENQHIEIHLEGEGVSDVGVPYEEITKIIDHLKEAALGCLPQGADSEDALATFNIVVVKEGCLALGAVPRGRVALGMTALVEIKRAKRVLPARTRYALGKLHKYTANRKLQADIRFDGDLTIELGEGRDYSTPVAAKVKGVTEVVGKCEGIGGSEAAPTAKFLLTTGQALTMSIKREHATKLALCLYRNLKIRGMATWSVDTLELLNLKPESFEVFAPPPIAESLKQLQALSRGNFDRINVEDFMKEVRGRE
jgi:hypothetical protein